MKKQEGNKESTGIFYSVIKRLFDIICGLLGIIILIPVTLIIKIISVCCGDFDSIFFTQKRIGKDGKEFNFYKYRSMVPNADKILFEMLENNPEIKAEYDKNKKLKDDPRIT
ncbi:MAG TPA: UDP-phosphate galactose phosphotransferase, partial [Firmicutes bacterium]|nr:UDP-phosphate galactose phosphotransferase [Bacillota bacterium]